MIRERCFNKIDDVFGDLVGRKDFWGRDEAWTMFVEGASVFMVIVPFPSGWFAILTHQVSGDFPLLPVKVLHPELFSTAGMICEISWGGEEVGIFVFDGVEGQKLFSDRIFPWTDDVDFIG